MGLDSVELVLEFEEKFGIEIPDKDAEMLVTAGQIHSYICQKLEAQATNSPEPLSKQDIWDVLVKIIAEQLGIEKNIIKPDSHLVNDFGLD